MSLAPRHGRAKAFGTAPMLERPKIGELPDGEPARLQERARDRSPDGRRLRKGAQETPSKGGQAHRGSTKGTHRVSARGLSLELQNMAKTLATALRKELTEKVCGGEQPGKRASALCKLAAVAIAFHDRAADRGDAAAVEKFSELASKRLRESWEYAVLDVRAKKKAKPGGTVRDRVLGGTKP